jgi:hypothetical protein
MQVIKKQFKHSHQQVIDIITKSSKSLVLIYCLSKSDTVSLATFLGERSGIKSWSITGDQGKTEKKRKIEEFLSPVSGMINCLCSTFNVGITQTVGQVSLVIYHSIPNRLSHVVDLLDYQESYILYGYKDKWIWLLNSGNAEDLEKVVEYCENFRLCRRVFLGSSPCTGNDAMCDICSGSIDTANYPFLRPVNGRDLLNKVLAILKESKKSITLIGIHDILFGVSSGTSENFGSCKKQGENKEMVMKFLRSLISQGILTEQVRGEDHGGVVSYVSVAGVSETTETVFYKTSFKYSKIFDGLFE